MLRRPIEQLRIQLQKLQIAEASYKRINTLFAEEYTDIYQGEELKLDEAPSLSIRDVSFSYNNDVKVLNKI